jgi:hypothetical protein
MWRKKTFIGGLIITLIIAVNASASSQWWEKKEEGWFFYKDNKPVKPKKEEKKEEKKPEIKNSQPSMLFTEKMQRREKELLSKAIEKPTEENLKAYMIHNQKMLEASKDFAFAWQKVLMKEPSLNYFPREEDYSKKTMDAIAKLREDAGIYFFYSARCDSCLLQAEQIIEFSQKHNFTIFPISVDGSVLPELSNTRMDNGIVANLGVDKVPALFLVFPKERKIEPLASSYISAYDIERRLLYYVQEIIPQQWDFDENLYVGDSLSSYSGADLFKQ